MDREFVATPGKPRVAWCNSVLCRQQSSHRHIARADSMCCRSTSIACMSKIVGALVRCKRFYEFSNQPPEFLHGALGAFAQRSFEFRERHLDGIEVWRICRQIAECCTDSVDC